MPTDLDAVSARKRAAQVHAQPEVTMLLFWLIICFGMIGLLFEVLSAIAMNDELGERFPKLMLQATQLPNSRMGHC